MAPKNGLNFPKRGEVYWVNLDPTVGSEIRKKRPALIVSNDEGNEFSSVVIIAPITSQKARKKYPFEVQTKIKQKEARILLNQCRAIDKKRIGNKLDKVSDTIMRDVEAAIRVVFSIH